MKLSHVALALSLALASAAPAWAQTVPSAPPAPGAGMQRTPPVAGQTAGNLARFLVGPGGRVHGLALDNGAVVMMPPQLAQELATRVRVGQPLRVEGFTHPGAGTPIFHRATVRAADGTVLSAPPALPPGAQPGMMGHEGGMMGRGHGGMMGQGHGGWGMRDPAQRAQFQAMRAQRLAAMPQQTVSGTVQQVITGPRGGVHTLLLSNNVTVMVPHPMSPQLQQRGVRVGEAVRATGRGNTTPQGTGLVAEQLTFADGTSVSASLLAPPPAR